jgi:hypothetical protein
MSDPTGTPFSTERELADDVQDDTPVAEGAVRPDVKPGPPNPPVDEEALAKGEETLARVKPY